MHQGGWQADFWRTWFFGREWGPEMAKVGNRLVLLLCGGDKTTQTADIKNAGEYLNDYKRRTTDDEKDD